MQIGIRNLLAGCLVLALVTTIQVDSQNTCNAAVVVNNCKCGKSACRKCRPQRQRCRRCPKCQQDCCELTAECVKQERICFEVEQKLICVPKVSLPWRKGNQPCGCDCASKCRHRCGKTRTITVLKTKTYECDVCEYKWKVFEPQDINSSTQPAEQPAVEPEPEIQGEPGQPQFDDTELYDPAGDDVPTAPTMNSSSRSTQRRFGRR